MNDKELLELAAKAAGIEIVGLVDAMIAQPDHRKGGYVIRNDRGGDSCWNPLTDDGDALRLAVKLDLIDERQWKAPITKAIYDECKGDWYAATRRAIVRAAAVIGEQNELI